MTAMGHPLATKTAPEIAGGLPRAAELVLAALRGSPPVGAPQHFELHVEDPWELARRLSQHAGVDGRVRTLPAEDLAKLTRHNAVLAHTPDGWLVAHGGHGTLVTAVAERRIALTARSLSRIGLKGRIEAVVLEPRLELETVSARSNKRVDPWTRLRSFLRLERQDLLALIAYSIVLGGLSLAVPIAVQVMVNTIAFGSLLQPLVVLSLLLLGVLSLSALLQVVQWYAVELLQRRLFVRVTEDFARRMLATQFEAHDTRDTRELVNRVFEVPTLQKTIGSLVLDGLALALQTLAGLLLVGFYHPFLLAFDVVLILALGAVIVAGAGAIATAKNESQAKYAMAAWLETLADKPDLFKRDNAALFAARRADVLVREYLGARRAHYRHVMRQLLGGVGLQMGAMVGLLGLGGVLVMEGELTLGQLVAAELVVGVVGAGFAKLGKHLEKVYDLFASIDKLGKVIDLPVDPVVESSRTSTDALSVSTKSLRLSWGGEDVGCKLTSTIEGGEKVRLIAPRRQHEDMLLEALAGLRTHRSGTLMAGVERNSRARSLLRQRALLLRPGQLIASTIADNLRLGAPELAEDQAWPALERVGLAAKIAKLPLGLETELSPRGAPLTPEEQVRLTIARVLVAKPGLLLVDRVLDELTPTDDAAQEAIAALIGPEAPWTTVVVTERDAIAGYCARVITPHAVEDAR